MCIKFHVKKNSNMLYLFKKLNFLNVKHFLYCFYIFFVFKLVHNLIAVEFVLGDASIQIQPFSFPVKSVIGRRISVTCTPILGEKMDFKWLKNDKELTKGLNVDIRSFSDLSNLVIDPLKEEDSGNYTCLVKSRGMTGSYTTMLEVLGTYKYTFQLQREMLLNRNFF